MFGHVRANVSDLSEEEKERYRAVYCGLCHCLGKRFGGKGRMALTYDFTFLTLFLNSLYEPEEADWEARCVTHPGKPRAFVQSEVTDYAADMTVALAYYKSLDDWQDDRKLTGKAYAELLGKSYAQVKKLHPRQTAAIEKAMAELSAVEKRRDPSPDAAADCFGRLMGELFVPREDYWANALRVFGTSLGRYIYMADAACDYDEDKKSGSYNPVLLMDKAPEDMRDTLMQLLGDASVAFERLPLVRDEHLLKNILYSGIWQQYNESMQKRKDGNRNG